MEEALEILWTYARRQPIESNGKTVVATISQSIAAIRLIMRLEGRFQKSGERKVNSGKLATPINTTHDCPASTPSIYPVQNRYSSTLGILLSLGGKGKIFSARAKPSDYKTFLSYDQAP